jgi:3'(2'), 5'-bisphosphate nucleotidase
MKGLIEIAIAAALEAGSAIIEIYKGSFTIEQKEDNSPLTTADKKSHSIINAALEKTGIPVLSEEGRHIPFAERKNWDRFWLIDPLDGTKEFIKRNDEFTVNIALVEGQKPIMGIIYVPVLDELYFASKDIGSFKITEAKIKIKENYCIEDLVSIAKKLPLKINTSSFVIVASRSHMSEETQAYIEKTSHDKPKVELISRGSSLKICMVAEGVADVYPRFAPTSEWDTAAGHAIALFSGAQVTQINEKEPLIYNKNDLLNPWFIVKR